MSLWFGYEWEIAASAVHADGSAVEMGEVLDGYERMLVEHMKHVDGESNGWWLESGGRFYRDASEGGLAHNEYASPECENPDELLRQTVAAERMLLHLGDLLGKKEGYAKVMLSKSNVSHASAESWGAHENYEASRPVPNEAMLAWLATRFILSGSGGLDVTYPGIRFSLSPRVHFFSAAVNNCTQWTRGLHNVGKASPYGRRHRVHVIAGDGNRAALSTWLKFGCTALVVRMLDAGCYPSVQLADAVAAAKRFALDPNFEADALTNDGKPLGILDIQHKFLDAVVASVDQFPGWAQRVIEEWSRALECLENRGGWRFLSGRLDWPAKLDLFGRVLDRAGWTWERIAEVNARIDSAAGNLQQMSPKAIARHIETDQPFPVAVLRYMKRELEPDLFEEFHALRQQLSVVDARYMELGNDSLHARISQPFSGGDTGIWNEPADPLELPSPMSGRAGVRAAIIRTHGWKGALPPPELARTFASWTGFLCDGKHLPMFDVEDVPDTEWKVIPPEPPPMRRVRDFVPADSQYVTDVRNAIRTAEAAVDSGEYESGIAALDSVREIVASGQVYPTMTTSYWKHVVRIQARRQRESELDEAAATLESVDSNRIEALWDSCNARCHIGLAGHQSVSELLELVILEMNAPTHLRRSGVACWKSHMALWHNRNCRFPETLGLLEPTLVNGDYEDTSWSVQARILTQLAEARRMLGDLSAAHLHLNEAEMICRRHFLTANLWDLVMTGRVRLLAAQGRREVALKLLSEEILPAQRRLGMPGWLRSQLLIARLAPERHNRIGWMRVKKSLAFDVSYFSGYARCPLMTHILGHWTEWWKGEPDPNPPEAAEVMDEFWGV
jgi:hypothetical protein